MCFFPEDPDVNAIPEYYWVKVIPNYGARKLPKRCDGLWHGESVSKDLKTPYRFPMRAGRRYKEM